MRAHPWIAGLVILLLAAFPTGAAAGKADEPDVVVVQHILIGFKRSVPDKKIDRSKREARELAESLFERASAEEADFDALVKEHTDDSYPGIYRLTNRDAPRQAGARTRGQMATGFGDVAFRLAIGEVGMAPYHGAKSPYGWHIIKRLE